MKIALLSNDDGIDAAGLETLQRLAEERFDEVWVVAPVTQRSQIGHRVTTEEPIVFEERGPRRYAVDGTPADCVRIALSHLMPVRPSWILSGINHGGNLGRHDAVISGTVAAVREGAFFGIPGVAISHYLKRGRELDWERAARHARVALDALWAEAPLRAGEYWNVNLPHLGPEDPPPQVVPCEAERLPLQVRYLEHEPGRLSYAGDYHGRGRSRGSDVDVCFRGDISLTKARL